MRTILGCLSVAVVCLCSVVALKTCSHPARARYVRRPAALPAVASPSYVPALPVRAVHRTEAPREQSADSPLAAVASQSDPSKLATLGIRGANPRVKRIVYWLAVARAQGRDPGEVIDQAQRMNGSADTPRAPLVRAALLRNLKIADGLGLLTPQNMELMRRGNAPRVTRGPYNGEPIEVDHIVPFSIAPEVGNELANLEMLPRSLNRRKQAKVGERQLAVAKQMQAAGLLSEGTMTRLQNAFRPAATSNVELNEEKDLQPSGEQSSAEQNVPQTNGS